MIQRKQSLWLLIAALLCGGVFIFDLYRYTAGTDSKQLRVADHFPTLLLAVVMTVLPLVTVFMFKKRKRQTAMTVVSILAVLSFTTMVLTRVGYLSTLTPPATNGSYWIGAVLPPVSLVFLILAIIGIRKDEKLVRSADRLR